MVQLFSSNRMVEADAYSYINMNVYVDIYNCLANKEVNQQRDWHIYYIYILYNLWACYQSSMKWYLAFNFPHLSPIHGILNLRQCMQHFSFWLRVRCWSNKSFLIFQFIFSCRFFRLHCKHQIFNILQYFKYISDCFWLGVCILNGNERINWRKFIYSQYNPYKKVSLYRKVENLRSVHILW